MNKRLGMLAMALFIAAGIFAAFVTGEAHWIVPVCNYGGLASFVGMFIVP